MGLVSTAAAAVLLFLSAYADAKLSNASYFYNKTRPLVIAHRGSSGQYPEHTLGAYTSAYYYGADYVELDLQITKDGHLVTSHDPCLKETTNIESYAKKYEDRKSNYIFPPYDNIYANDYLIKDFTLAELKLLRRKMRYSTRNQYFNEQYQIMTLEETIETMLNLNANFPRTDISMPVGLYIETKMYNFYLKTYKVDLAEELYKVLKKYDLETVEKASAKLPIIVECFEKESLVKFATLSDLPLVYLLFWNNAYMSTPYNITEISTYAHGVGPRMDFLFDYKNETHNNTAPSLFIEECHSAGLAVHPYTMQDDMLRWTDNPIDEHVLYMNKQVDGIFTEFPHMTRAAFIKFPNTNQFPPATTVTSECGGE